jgi:hypothetical protein
MSKLILVFFFYLFSLVTSAQVSGLQLMLKPQLGTNKYDVSIIITSGNATTMAQRLSFISSLTVISPTGSTVSIDSILNPVKDPDTGPAWSKASYINPYSSDSLDYHQFSYNPTPSSFYTEMILGDTVRLFSLNINTNNTICKNKIRLYKNGFERPSSELGGRNFLNSIAIGSSVNDYKGNYVVPSSIKVTNSANDGLGSLRFACNCALDSSLIEIELALLDTINVENTIPITKDLTIKGKYVSNRIKKNLMNPIFDVDKTKTLNLQDVELVIKTSTAVTRGIHNKGNLNLKNVIIRDQNMHSPTGQTILNEGNITISGQTRISKS